MGRNKPIILVVGAPHSMTSMVAAFLTENGAWNKNADETMKLISKIDYPRYEDDQFNDWLNSMRKTSKLIKPDLVSHINSLPQNEIVLIKAPMAALFLDKLKEKIDREIKVVWCIRNPADVIMSTMDKGGHSYLWAFHRYCAIYNAITQCPFNLHVLMVERLYDISEMKSLLKFCGLNTENFKKSSVKPRKERNIYIQWRIRNAIWKRINRLIGIW